MRLQGLHHLRPAVIPGLPHNRAVHPIGGRAARWPDTSAYTIGICPNAVLFGTALVALDYISKFNSKAALLFLVATLLFVLRRPKEILSEVYAARALWLLVGWCLLSVFWSNYPDVTLRYAIQLAFTFAIGISAGYRMSPTNILKTVMVSGIIMCLGCFVFGRVRGDDGAWLGIFASKNALSQAATVVFVASSALLLGARTWRLAAVITFLMSAFLLVKADSAGGTIAMLVTLSLLAIIRSLRRTTPWQRVFLGLSAILLTLTAILLVSGFFTQLSDLLLELTGKDATLTGRTDLWRVAFGQIAEHPLLGQGFKGFWVIGNPLAEELWAQFGISTRTGFHFHNTLISNAVEIGLIGVILQAGLIFYALWGALRWAIEDPCAEALFIAGFMLRQLILMNTELVAFNQFMTVTVLTVLSVVLVQRRNQARRQERAQRTVV